jgi:FkbM family methyltransferase
LPPIEGFSVLNFLRSTLNRILPRSSRGVVKRIKGYLPHAYSVRTYSQEGEDMMLRRLFEDEKQGFYVDVGAHHPKLFSNTCLFYAMGWRGINIDALPGSMKRFQRARPRDINLEKAISDKRETLTFYVFDEPALSGFSESLTRKRVAEGNYHIVDQRQVTTEPLSDILEAYLPNGQRIDFLSVDVEGHDLRVLRSNDWKKYRPRAVLVESLMTGLEEISQSETYRFMKSERYTLLAKSLSTLIFIEEEARQSFSRDRAAC